MAPPCHSDMADWQKLRSTTHELKETGDQTPSRTTSATYPSTRSSVIGQSVGSTGGTLRGDGRRHDLA
eukprot:symbB.v1.2.027661.t1/scaffold2855.1/size68771/2